jgi:hypothetical protein
MSKSMTSSEALLRQRLLTGDLTVAEIFVRAKVRGLRALAREMQTEARASGMFLA